MQIEIGPPVEHDAKHDVEIVIQGIPAEAIFCCRMFVALKLSDHDVQVLYEELGDWLKTQ